MKRHRLLRIFAVITSIGAYSMLMLGVVVTNTGSGQGCGNSWPFCHGQLIPDSMPLSTFYEYSHRTVSGADGFLILTLTVWAWLTYRQDARVKILAFMSLFFVVLQGALGAVTVVYEGTFAKYPLLALHFGFSLISLASVILLTVHLFQINKEKQATSQKTKTFTRGLRFAVWGITAYTYVVVYTGALVQYLKALMGCGRQFPGCGSNYLPGFTSTAGVQLLHRYAAASIWLLLLALLIVIIRRKQMRRDIVVSAIWAFILVTLQAVSGIMNVFSGGLAIWGAVHTTLIAALFAVQAYLCMQSGWPWAKRVQVLPQLGVQENSEQYQKEYGAV